MKKLITLAFSIIFTMTAFGQRLEYERSSNWFFGLNAGATWNTTDVQNKTYAGWGFLLGRSFNYDYGRRISYDLRLRYLRGKWYGQDTDSTNLSHLGADYNGALSQYKDGLGYTVNNYEANVHELGLELAIHFNRFRDRTGWDPYIFGGANIVWNETYGDLVDQSGFLAGDTTYAYNQIAMNKPAIEQALDENYETALDGTQSNRFNVNFMPSLGVGIAYDFGPRFSFGLEHKTTFALRDDFDGYVDSEPNWGFLENDVYHYTSANLTWRFRGRGNYTRPIQPQPDPNPPIIGGGGGSQPCQLPEVRVTNPLQRTETVLAQNYVYRAEVRFVQSRSQITMRINGIETTNFLYNPSTHQLESYLYLQPGNNIIEVTGRNSCGTGSETSTLIFNDCIDPVVYFENVCSSTFTAQVDQRSYTVEAQISNATSIQFTVNGVQSTNYTYNSTTGQFSSNILLNEGQNTIRITAISGCGTDTGTSVVTYTDCPDPIVNFASGNNGFVSVSQANFNLNAYIYNVTSSNNIKVRLNGSIRNFNFNAGTRLLTSSLLLNPGQNTIQIIATTNCGTDTETLTVDYTPCVNPNIQMVLPIGQSTTSTNGTQVIQATMFNVANIGQIQLFVNGNLQQGGTFNPVTKMFQANVALNSGFNTIQITVLNDCGSDTETITVNHNPCSTPDVQMILPAANGGLVSSPSQLVQAMVFNVTNISEIQTYVNGVAQNGGTYNIANGLYQNTVGLTLGVNTIQVVATNGCGSDVQTVTITYRACEAPQITITSPTTNPLFTSAANVNVSAIIGAVTSTSQVQVTVNGVVDASGATYNSSSITYNNNVNLNVGNNVIVITATNACGTVSEQTNVVREVVVVDPQPEDSITICFVHCNNVGEPVTMTIPLSQWPSYQSQGAQLGPCPIIVDPVDEPMTICFKANNNPPTTMTILTSEWPAYQAMGATQGPCPEPTMDICFNGNPLTIPVSQWSTFQSQGATEGPCPIVQEEMIVICVGGTEMTIPASQWPAYQIEGADLGPCPVVDPEMVICIDGTERTILTSQWPTYQAQGATQGPCPVDDPMTICMVVNGVRTTMTILTSEWPTYQAQGAMAGPCPSLPDPAITICMTVNGTPTTMTILTSEWPSYQAQGATQGPCPAADPQITICLKETTMTILTSQWATYQAQGATLGACVTPVDPDMVICLNGAQQTIATSQWATYQAQGATEGPCPVVDPEMTVCLNGTELTILTSEWSKYQGQGATQGPCPVVDPQITICLKETTMTILTSQWATYQAQGATLGACVTPDPDMVICLEGSQRTISTSQWPTYQAQGATQGPCEEDVPMQICMVVNGVRTTLSISSSEWPTYQAQGAMQGPCPSLPDPTMTICTTVNGVPTTMTILTSQWPGYQSEGATQGPCPAADPQMTICLNGNTKTILTSEWAKYQAKGATIGACIDGQINVGNGGLGNSDTLNGNIERPTNGGGEDELLFGNRTITICHTPNGSIASQTIQIPLSEWEQYQQLGATLGACAGSLNPANGGGKLDINNTGTGNGDGVGNVPVNPTGNNGTQPNGGNMPVVGNGSQAAKDELIRKQKEEEARIKAAKEEAARQAEAAKQKAAAEKARQIQLQKEAAAKKAAELKASQEAAAKAKKEQAAKEAAAAKARQEQAVKDAAAQKAAKEEAARRQAEEAKRKAAQEAAAAKARQEQSVKDAAAQKAAKEEAARRQAEEAKRKAAQDAAAAKARQEKAVKDAAAQKAAKEAAARRQAEEAKRKAAQDAAAAKARQEKAAKDAAAAKARQEKAARDAAAKKAAQEKAARDAAARRQAEEAKRKAAQEAAAAKARQEKAAREAEARRKAEEAKRKAAQQAEAKRKAAQEAAAAKARQEKAARDAAAKKAAQEKAAKAAAAKKAAEAAARKKAEEQRKAKEREGGR